MNDFDLLLETQLRLMLDPVVASRPPTPRGNRVRKPLLAVVVPPYATVFGGAVAEMIPIPVAVEQPAVP